jgi:hypothetical protein
MAKGTDRTLPVRPAGYPRTAHHTQARLLMATNLRKTRGPWRTNADKPRQLPTAKSKLATMLEEQKRIVRSKAKHAMPLPGVWTPPTVQRMATQDFLRHDGEVEDGLRAADMSHLL